MAKESGRSSGSRMLLMLARTGFVASLLIGLGSLLGIYAYGGAVVWIHVVFGLLFLVPAWLLAAAPVALVRLGATLGTLGAILAAIGALWAPGLSAWFHIILMLAAIALIEMGSGRARKA